MDGAVLQQHGPDTNAAVHRAVGREHCDSAAIDRATVRFQFFNDLHRANFRGAGDRATGKAGLEQVGCIQPFCQRAGNRADQMVNIGKALQLEKVRNAYAADLTDAPEIIAQQVDNHQVFGAVLRILLQAAGIVPVSLRIRAARGCALDRLCFDDPVHIELQEALR